MWQNSQFSLLFSITIFSSRNPFEDTVDILPCYISACITKAEYILENFGFAIIPFWLAFPAVNLHIPALHLSSFLTQCVPQAPLSFNTVSLPLLHNTLGCASRWGSHYEAPQTLVFDWLALTQQLLLHRMPTRTARTFDCPPVRLSAVPLWTSRQRETTKIIWIWNNFSLFRLCENDWD